MDEQLAGVDEQLEMLTISTKATQDTVLRTREHINNRFDRIEAGTDHVIADLKVARSDIRGLRQDLQMEEKSRGLSDETLFVGQQETAKN